ncbi:exodeoxyribonuclease VII large subunit [Amphibacillus sediminis]|uniref:exodeoxyribonuclease VII large subunit n=1 Tax=Amphibacillus sediminis TaxID=360185 RepID=UPI0008313C60|nr:exodeoxyribonuclease VII large subunit [Amphibacillus sediminis]
MPDKYLTVTALTKYIKHKFESDSHMKNVWIKAEISNFKHHSRGHMYFTLKDDQARILSVMFAGYNQYLKFTPENGMHVIVRGDVNVYEPQGQYQFYVQEMHPDGLGALHLAYQQLKDKLDQEGLFAEVRKKSIPLFPSHIGLITSTTGAAIQDMLTTIRRRLPSVKISIFPVLVQGRTAKDTIKSAIEQANTDRTIDTLIVGRGGGSIEELWAFNEEVVARAMVASRIPIISAVGHETDFTIADLVADLRAATPTAAAELAVPSKLELVNQVRALTRQLTNSLNQKVENNRGQLQRLQASYAFKYPKQLAVQKEQQLDRLLERLEHSTRSNLKQYHDRLNQSTKALLFQHPKHRIHALTKEKIYLTKALNTAYNRLLQVKLNQFEALIDKLHVLSPLATMKRGYSISYSSTGQLIKSVRDVEPGEQLTVQLGDGHLDCQVWGIEEDHNDKQ